MKGTSNTYETRDWSTTLDAQLAGCLIELHWQSFFTLIVYCSSRVMGRILSDASEQWPITDRARRL